MAVFAAMLRGVNLGPRRRMRMEDLRAAFESVGLRDVETLLQSGNVVFRTPRASQTLTLTADLERAIERKFGFRADVVLRSPAELRQTASQNPFAGRPAVDPARLLVWFLASDPGDAARAKALAVPAAPEEVHAVGRELYIYYTSGMARPKLNMAAVEKALGVPGTGRNWNTVGKLLDLAERLEAR